VHREGERVIHTGTAGARREVMTGRSTAAAAPASGSRYARERWHSFDGEGMEEAAGAGA